MLRDLIKDEIAQGKFWNKAWSLVEGCSPVSPGCKNCWLAGMYNRNLPNLSPGLIDPKTKHFNGNLTMSWDRLDIPLHRRKPTVYAIWSDLFHQGVPEGFQESAFENMMINPQHFFLVITKRPSNAFEFLQHWPYAGIKNVIIMVTMEDQQRADERAPYAMKLASKGWHVGASCEPLLGPVDLSACLPRETGISWVITGGESGTGARPVHPDWVRDLRDQARATETPFLFKSWGTRQPLGTIAGRQVLPLGDYNPISGYGYRKTRPEGNNRLLDGREWNEVPEI